MNEPHTFFVLEDLGSLVLVRALMSLGDDIIWLFLLWSLVGVCFLGLSWVGRSGLDLRGMVTLWDSWWELWSVVASFSANLERVWSGQSCWGWDGFRVVNSWLVESLYLQIVVLSLFDPSFGYKYCLFLVWKCLPSYLGDDLTLLALHVRELLLDGSSLLSLKDSVGWNLLRLDCRKVSSCFDRINLVSDRFTLLCKELKLSLVLWT